MTFVAIADVEVDGELLGSLEKMFGTPVVRHASGRPWIFTDRTLRVIQREFGDDAQARICSCSISDALDSSHECWSIDSSNGIMRAHGDLSSSHRICWARVKSAVLVSDRADTLARITVSGLDPYRLMIAAGGSLPLLPYASRCFWRDVFFLLPGDVLEVTARDVRTRRWWRPPLADQTLEESAIGVRKALLSELDRATTGADSVTADLSGGLDSMSLVYLLRELGADFTTYSAFSADVRNPDQQWAERAVRHLGGLKNVQLASPSHALRAFDFETELGRTDEPLLWKANLSYLQDLATALSPHERPVHINGLGGDELFTFLPGSLHAARRNRLRGHRSLAARARAMNRWGRRETARSLRDDASFATHLRIQGAELWRNESRSGPQVCSWIPPVQLSRLVTASTRAAISDALRQTPAGVEPYALTHGHHQVMEGIAFQGSVVRTVNQLFGESMTWHAPMLGRAVVAARLRMIDGIPGPDGVAKPLLAEAMKPTMPPAFFGRRDKADYSNDVYREFARHRTRMRGFFDGSVLVDLGIIDMDAVDRLLTAGTQNNEDLFDLERVIELERWSRAAV